ncbi:transporter substrate-binding domain-containing protein [Pseudomonas gingeri]
MRTTQETNALAKRLVISALAIFLTSTSIGAHAGQAWERIEKNKEMVVATDVANPPASFLAEGNNLDGFDVAVAREIAKRIGVNVRFVTPSWDVITAGNWQGRWDLSVGSMTPTAQRRRVLDFPAIYYYAPGGIAVHVKNTTIKSASDAKGKKVGTQAGSTYEQYLLGTLNIDSDGQVPFVFQVKDPVMTTYEGEATALDDLRLGDGVRLDAVVVSQQAILGAIKSGYPIRQVGGPLFYEPLGVAIEKGDPEFVGHIQQAVDSMKKDGVLKQLSEKWFHADYSSTIRSDS